MMMIRQMVFCVYGLYYVYKLYRFLSEIRESDIDLLQILELMFFCFLIGIQVMGEEFL